MLLDNTKNGFILKSNFELIKAYFLFKIISSRTLTNFGKNLLKLCLKLRLPILFIVKATVFRQFCSGENLQESFKTVKKLNDRKVKSYLHYSVESQENEKTYDNSLKEVIKSIEFAASKDILDFTVFKPTAIASSEILNKVNEKKELSDFEKGLHDRILDRFDIICRTAFENQIKVLVDAEESWLQGAIDDIVLKMMIKYNTHSTIVYNTSQMYRHDRLKYLNELKKLSIENGFYVGIKLVRGAYIEKENKRAIKLNYKSPICESKNVTDINFNEGARFILSNLDNFSLFCGSHNEKSIYDILEIMKDEGIKKTDSKIWFGQLYGMSDNISFNLAEEGYNVIKYLPFGPVKEVIPYLIRRAEENTSVKGQTSRELELIKMELKRRRSN
ncbi:MAG: proline dehydrogenase family protein [Bacteroidetes bacterium]|nr:proline dehydrogenase family protein [Bacteroidota bacterium]MDA1225927.1 proline dehydrogenase family protein [Bacteroidota bacterium]